MTDASYVPEFLGGAPADADIGPNGVLRITVGPKPLPVNGGSVGGSTGAKPYVPEFLGGPPSITAQPPGKGFEWSAAVTDVPKEIANSAGENLSAINRGLNPFSQSYQEAHAGPQSPLDMNGLGATGEGILAVPGLIASPITGAARSLIGHSFADALHSAGSVIAPQTAAQDDPEQMYQQGKGVADQAMLAVGAKNLPIPVPTPLSPVAQTAARIGAPLPRGIASESPIIQATTAKLQSIPFAGEKIGQRLLATEGAAGDTIGDIASQMTGGANSRAAADVVIRPGLQGAIDSNRATIDGAYSDVRNSIDRDAKFTMPQTAAAIQNVIRSRANAGWTKPTEGLEQFQNVARGATFEGAHRARVDARSAGNPLAPHPGYNAADFNGITRAMSADLRNMVKAAAVKAGNDPAKALASFDKAEGTFKAISSQNDKLSRLVNAKGEGAISTLLGAAREKGGDARLLAQLKSSMSKDDFSQVGGSLLGELGYNAAHDKFSLSQFTTNWNKLSDPAKRILFEPAHLRNIDEIAGLGTHIKSALARANTSHTGDLLVLYDLLKTGVEGAVAIGAGVLSPLAGGAAATGFLAANLLTRALAKPAEAASMAAWMRAYRNITYGGFSTGRAVQLKIATRNLSNNLGIMLNSASGTVPSAAQNQPANQ